MLEKININFKSTKIAFKTLGCKLNFSETSEISRSLDNKIFSSMKYIQVKDLSKSYIDSPSFYESQIR